MQRYKCTVEYDGSGFFGWQRQNHCPSIQQTMEEAIEKFAGHKVDIRTAGRTDAGVHALGQVVHFDLEKDFPCNKVIGATNFHLRPAPIALLDAVEVDNKFNARFSAKKRYYEYRIINRWAPVVIEHKRITHIKEHLDEIAMQEAANLLIGKHDFTSFRDSKCQAKSPVKTLDEVRVVRHGDRITIYVSAPSFLHHMVRNIAGTLKMVGSGRWTVADVQKALDAKDRRAAGPTAPPDGLYLTKVTYEI